MGPYREEALRCWGADQSGQAPGYIAEMVGCEYRYDPALQAHVKTGEPAPAEPRSQRAWRRLASDQQEGVADDPNHAHDGDLVLEYFGLSGPSAPRKGIIADIGCGDGWIARHFVGSKKFETVFALDLSWAELDKARDAAEQKRLAPEDGLFLMRADAEALPFKDCQLDYAWFGQGLHMTKDPVAALTSIARVLRPGGKLVASTMTVCFDSKELREIAEAAGFTGVRLRKSAGRTIFTLSAAKP